MADFTLELVEALMSSSGSSARYYEIVISLFRPPWTILAGLVMQCDAEAIRLEGSENRLLIESMLSICEAAPGFGEDK